MAAFSIAYTQYIQPWEGGYAWIDGDSGGETYAGIARNYNKQWRGWIAIDFEKHKRKVDRLPHNSIVPGVQGMVNEYYKHLWDKYGFDFIKSQPIANILFDFAVNSGSGNLVKLLGQIFKGVNGLPALIGAINADKNPDALHDTIKAMRVKFYQDIVKAKPSQEKFLRGWLNRINSFPNMSALKIALPLVLVFVVTVIILLSLNGKP